MTREEVEILKAYRDKLFNSASNQLDKDIKAFDAAIKALEQEPCNDVISRQAVDTLVDELARAISDERCCISRGRSTATIMQDIFDLPSVNPQEPFMNKPCVAHQICHEDKIKVLDKIKLEIELKEKTLTDKYEQQKYGVWTDDVLQIIDKYKAESGISDADSN